MAWGSLATAESSPTLASCLFPPSKAASSDCESPTYQNDLQQENPSTPLIRSSKMGLKRRRLLEDELVDNESGLASPVKHQKKQVAKRMSAIRQQTGNKVHKVPSQPSAANQKQLKVAGPTVVQTLRGRLHGREVALVFCGEAHEDAIDLTRRRAVIEPKEGWVEQPRQDAAGVAGDLWPCCPEEALRTEQGLSMAAAKRWAEEVLAGLDEGIDFDGAMLVYEPRSSTAQKSIARLFLPGSRRSAGPPLAAGATLFEWGDLDLEARDFNRRRLTRVPIPVEEQDALVNERKQRRTQEGIELFDDWLLRQVASSSTTKVQVQLVLEAPVPAHEVELHVEEGVPPAPRAHRRLRELEPDSDEDADEANTPGNGSYLDYLRRRVLAHLPAAQLHAVDARGLGDADDSALPARLRGSFDSLVAQVPPACSDAEEEELKAKNCNSGGDVAEKNAVPSWEAFFGGAADLLYYAPHVKADYTPFLKDCVGSAAKMRQFFQALFFETVPAALAPIRLDQETRPSATVRSLLHQAADAQGEVVYRPAGQCSSGRQTVPVRAAPMDRYLKARGFEGAPRTWVAGIAERLRDAGLGHLVEAARSWYLATVDQMLRDPKNADTEGDNFVAWLRACHREIFDDIDTYDPMKLRRQRFAQSKAHPRSKEHRYNMKEIGIPGIEQAFEEFKSESGASSSRQQVLSKILVDAFQLRSVDLAMVLKSAEVAVRAPRGSRVVIVHYAGLDHTRSAVKFWRSQGFSHEGLRNRGVVGKLTEYKDTEPRALAFPTYLRELDKLFPVPTSVRDVDRRMLRPRLGAKQRRKLLHSVVRGAARNQESQPRLGHLAAGAAAVA
eukprot:TRINITY_DN104657_c0_g1_i1.p1 TRINITY_DN104657_c0_g1~~TRINITY_DN104657_c0_g1_i1.p1  ORF type:complete len:878 (+),score=162.68 TRINITY_DN104657_c0_g1_i1:119-2635(+)